jgi:hypothetical protein
MQKDDGLSISGDKAFCLLNGATGQQGNKAAGQNFKIITRF